ncbi:MULTISPECIES: hypothetical protein [unclassified Methanoculleus]|jgi:hypothetical protein|uniref:hypothetical protein n=1 Tax=unclassified Methanoculleus TaxID=2619537 RepID=UPI00319DCB6E
MEKNQKIILAAGCLVTFGLFFIDPFFALIALVCVLALLMSFHIMGDMAAYPLVTAELSENAREIVVTNAGTERARNIRVALVPLNVEFEVASLDPDEKSGFSLTSMVSEAKAVVTYENSAGREFSRSYPLSALGAGYDPTEPMFPIFGNK